MNNQSEQLMFSPRSARAQPGNRLVIG